MIEDQPFRLAEWFRRSPRRALLAPFRSAIEHVLGLRSLENLYRRLPRDDRPFWDKALAVLDVGYEASHSENIPRTGPLLIVANHPYGGLDGLVLASLLKRIRPDVKLLANHLLGRIPELRDLFLFVDPFGARPASAGNAVAMRSAIRWVRAGGALALFPAGEVSHAPSADGTPIDSAWPPALARLVEHTGASVLPVFFEGSNSRLFRLAGRIHPALRTALLPRELLRQRHRTIAVRIGSPIPSTRLADLQDHEQMASYLRIRTYALGEAPAGAPSHAAGAAAPRATVAAAEPPDRLAGEIAGLAPSQVLGRSGDLTVCVGAADELPHTLREIGRLRELAFRAAGEGSGAAHDLDAFDAHYLHLFVWNHERREIVGAYRVGRTDDVLARFGTRGLYTSTLFWYDPRLMAEIGPALELGRAFVRIEYQRDYSPLLLLWRGIGLYVSRHPRYRILFGPVSISNDYNSISRQILAAFVHATALRPELARLVTPRNPPAFLRSGRGAPVAGAVVRSLAEAGALLAEIEADRKGVPVLLRQYLKLNARLLGFNLDPAFGNALDALMLVDLMDVDREILSRYMGKAAALAFIAHHVHAGERRAS